MMDNQSKQWRSFREQLSILQGRGLVVDEPAAALRCLERLGYYRLSGYWYPFRVLDADSKLGGSPRRLGQFIVGSHFKDVVELYVFDKKLRLLALDALERIEMALRIDIAYLLGKKDIHAHENPDCLHGAFSKQVKTRGYAKGRTAHQLWLKSYQRNLHRARREPFVEHYQKNYGRLPVWVAIEVWDFGMMSKMFDGMKIPDKDKIAAKYGARNGSEFATWLKSLNFIRNVSAHHSRLWNINILERSALPQENTFWQALNNARPFFYFCLIQKLMRVISPGSTWAERLISHIESFPEPENGAVTIEDFGLTVDWRAWPLWGQK
ncbi:Abi family protein [uncultured Gilvimarinus sp.]|uniref:Abi family protein n=1 Tax=uncultured Gilvimarinus sp. TaxID=1689143 RepID=UPI0030D97354